MKNRQWQTTSSREVLKIRANLIRIIHDFFNALDVLQVDTPALSQFANTDPSIESFAIKHTNNSGHSETELDSQQYFLHTSPEFPMKRLLACNIGSIYQICKVFRSQEQGRYHNPEFTLLEWYRLEMDHFELMDEIELLLKEINSTFPFYNLIEKVSYQNLFIQCINIDPLNCCIEDLVNFINQNNKISIQGISTLNHSDLCDLLMSHLIQEKMPKKSVLFVYDYPAAQASLAQLNKNQTTARRFEVFISGIEIANGFHELRDAEQQRQRFKNDQENRLKAHQVVNPLDENLIQALHHGLPNCAGVALGIDRLLMLLVNASHINEVLTFPFDQA